jgi:methylglutaconyl-CoA hydratase
LSEPVILSSADARGVATVTLNRPEIRNAFNEVLIGELLSTFERIATDPKVRLMVLTGNGKTFSAGGDLNWMRKQGMASEKENQEDGYRLALMLKTLDILPKPVIGRVHGAAYAGGIGLVACCDVVVAAAETEFSLSEVKLGLAPATIGPYVAAAIGPRQMRRYAVTGERFTADEARRIGLVHEVVPANELDAAIEKLIAEFLQGGPEAQASVKELVRDVAGRPIDEALMQDTAHRIARRRASPEGAEGIQAFLDKRKPHWARG